MTTIKIKGLCKGSFKYISQIFVVKERELEIGLPTDVKHVAHIGWDGPNNNSPTWMNSFESGSDVAMSSIGSIGGSKDNAWSSQDFEHTLGRQQSSSKMNNFPPVNTSSKPEKQKRKNKNTSSGSSSKPSSARSSSKPSSARSSHSHSSTHKSMLRDTEDGKPRRSLML